MLTVNDQFPEFNLTALSDIEFEKLNMENAFIKVNNETYKGKWKVIFFYPKDFTFICPTEIVGFSNLKNEFSARNTQILACSVDSEFVHLAWRKYHKPLNNIDYPIMSDVNRKLSEDLGILDKESGVSKRALFIVNEQDIIKFVMVTDDSVGRNPQEVLRVIDALQTGELCPCAWSKDQKTLNVPFSEF